ncbi:putative phosphodiesterase [Chitinophaga skermanii]|uniref:Putative phosphodiesterase n=2 Tax=Chitinophaga skermanii TaxID=331697 RepID=A0A327QPB6_9BACT|nr:putative phosphodiesterase [Chitinophaga skermanii]
MHGYSIIYFMIQIAIISDIHANLPALQAVLNDIDQRNISQTYCLGDLVDFAPWGNEVISLLQSRQIPTLLGNHDERVAFDQPIIPLPHHDAVETTYREIAIQYSKQTITEVNKRWLAERLYNLLLTYQTGTRFANILLVHGSPRSNHEYIYEAHPNNDIVAMLGHQLVDAVIMGHTHCSYIKQAGKLTIANVGSVGRSKEADRKATYAIVHISETGVSVEIVKVAYDVAAVANAIYNSELPNFYGDFLLQ